MSKITFKDIYIDGNKITEDSRKAIYLLPPQPLKYASNTWIYKTMPTMNQWLKASKSIILSSFIFISS